MVKQTLAMLSLFAAIARLKKSESQPITPGLGWTLSICRPGIHDKHARNDF